MMALRARLLAAALALPALSCGTKAPNAPAPPDTTAAATLTIGAGGIVTPKSVELTIRRMHGGKPWITSYDNVFVRAAGRAIEQGFGASPVLIRVFIRRSFMSPASFHWIPESRIAIVTSGRPVVVRKAV